MVDSRKKHLNIFPLKYEIVKSSGRDFEKVHKRELSWTEIEDENNLDRMKMLVDSCINVYILPLKYAVVNSSGSNLEDVYKRELSVRETEDEDMI